jgi:hypothetical protein
MTMLDLRLPGEVPLVLSHSQRLVSHRTARWWAAQHVAPPHQDGTIIDVDIVRSRSSFADARLSSPWPMTLRACAGRGGARKSYEELDDRCRRGRPL